MKLNDTNLYPQSLKSLSLLGGRDRFIVLLVVVITLVLALLDLVGVVLLGFLGSLSATGLSSNKTGDRVNQLLTFMNAEDFSFQNQISLLGGLAAFFFVLKTLCSLILTRKATFFLAQRGAVISFDLISKYLNLPLTSINQRSAQESIYALTTGVNALLVGVIGAGISLFADIALLLILGIGLFYIDAKTAMGSTILFGSVALFLYRSMTLSVRQLGEEQGKLTISSAQKIQEVLGAYREIFVRNRRKFYAEEIGNLRFRLANGSAKLVFMQNLSKYALELTLVLGSLILSYHQFTSYSTSRAIANVMIFVAASMRIIPAILRVQQGLLSIKSSSAQAIVTLNLARDLKEIKPKESKSAAFSNIHKDFDPSIELTNVSFSYSDRTEVISSIDLKISAGEIVAIVGSSGAGKTTLVDLILGVNNPSAGEIKISGRPPKEAFFMWPGAVSYVPQDVLLIEGSIKDNLILGYNASEINDEMCWEALKLAKIDSFIRGLKSQLDEEVGDRGTRLSGGQRQRLGIARALITRPRLIILDEATSALDGITESEIADSIRSLRGDTTVIVIAHRLSTIVGSDRIFYLENGQILATGTFEEMRTKVPQFNLQAQSMGIMKSE
jgi:ABC-type multidrug transport system fused ATPase/permease subunit